MYVDGANGIGALKLKELLEHIGNLPINIFNDGTNGILNFKVSFIIDMLQMN